MKTFSYFKKLNYANRSIVKFPATIFCDSRVSFGFEFGFDAPEFSKCQKSLTSELIEENKYFQLFKEVKKLLFSLPCESVICTSYTLYVGLVEGLNHL